ncbi:MAG: exo-alpha-sialidase, partial [Thermoguttaceae bacterium]|nr:exo-alpha-sialidase [Thermoguttaceae bacterium]
LDKARGYSEPSITLYQGRYYLTLRSDDMGYITASDDGLNFDPPIPWRWQSEGDGGAPGELLGSYNTQQHWLRLGEKLYLVYTRRGADNDHIFRHRAPLFIAQFDPQTMTLIRETEQVAVPEHGVALGNFGTTEVSDREGWVVVSERMPSKIKEESDYKKALARGASGAIWISRIFAEENK